VKTLKDLQPGDEVLVIPTYRSDPKPTEGTVVSVARVWMTVSTGFGHEEKFRIETGYDNADPSALRIATRDQWTEERDAEDLRIALRYTGVTVRKQLSSDQLRRILAIVAEGE
jgi:hypothetical protein